jgi:hypothetical protein
LEICGSHETYEGRSRPFSAEGGSRPSFHAGLGALFQLIGGGN